MRLQYIIYTAQFIDLGYPYLTFYLEEIFCAHFFLSSFLVFEVESKFV